MFRRAAKHQTQGGDEEDRILLKMAVELQRRAFELEGEEQR